MKKLCLILSFSFSLLGVFAQNELFKQYSKEANALFEESQCRIALPIWSRLLETDPTNYKLIEDVVGNHKKNKQLVIEIKSSASKAPTKLFGTNEALADKRTIFARNHIKHELISKGIRSKKK